MMTMHDIIDGLDSEKSKILWGKLCLPSAPLPRERFIQ
jgi:hypothetical protein